MIIPVNIEIETGEPEVGRAEHCRWATLMFNGVPVFRDLVYDTDGDGNRTDKRAAENVLYTFQNHLRRAFGEDL